MMKRAIKIGIIGTALMCVFISGCAAVKGEKNESEIMMPAESITVETGESTSNIETHSFEPLTSSQSAYEIEKEANPPCVMVNGIVYQSTGYKSSAKGCGNMDGEIKTSVDSSELPTENDQSNFGTGYTYQYGVEDRIVVVMDDDWMIFRDSESNDSSIPPEVLNFVAEIKDIREQNILVSVTEVPEMFMFNKGEYVIPADTINDDISVGDYVTIWCDGYVEESLPAILPCVYGVYPIDKDDQAESFPEYLNVKIASYADLNQLKELSAEDAKYIHQVFSNINWDNEGTTENLSDVYVEIDENSYGYDSNRGVLNDITNGRWTKLDNEVKDGINSCISKYVTLGQFD